MSNNNALIERNIRLRAGAVFGLWLSKAADRMIPGFDQAVGSNIL